jgi:DNA primase large subunit
MITNVKVFPEEMAEISKNVVDNLPEKIRISVNETFEPEDISESEYPPCIKFLIKEIGKGLSHPGRFTLVTFLSAVGYSTEDIIKLFRVTPDFNEKMTRYQVEHILGMRGSRIKYSVPSCKKIRSYGYCIPDEICKRYNIKHPLNYIRILRKRRG